MTFYYRTTSYTNEANVPEKKIALWKHVAEKKNWRIVKLPYDRDWETKCHNGYF